MRDSDLVDATEGGSGKQRIVTAIGIVVTCAVVGWSAPLPADAEMIDHALFRITVENMREGAGYYAAYDSALAVVYGPGREDVTETIRGFRMPTTFLVWRFLPDQTAIWWLFVIVAGVAGVLASRLVRRPVLGLVVTAYLLAMGIVVMGEQSIAQFMTTELWAVAPLLGALVMVRRKHWWAAAGLALLAVLVRELAAPLLVVGVGLALMGRVPRAPWLTAGGFAAGSYALHALNAQRFIDPDAAQRPIVDAVNLPWTIIEMTGFGLPAAAVVGPLLWLLAVHAKISDRSWLEVSVLLLPLVGFIIDRPYWGILVAPFVALWGINHVVDLGVGRIQTPTDVQTS